MLFEGEMSVKIQIDRWVKIKTCQHFHFFPPQGKFARWHLYPCCFIKFFHIFTRMYFISIATSDNKNLSEVQLQKI